MYYLRLKNALALKEDWLNSYNVSFVGPFFSMNTLWMSSQAGIFQGIFADTFYFSLWNYSSHAHSTLKQQLVSVWIEQILMLQSLDFFSYWSVAQRYRCLLLPFQHIIQQFVVQTLHVLYTYVCVGKSDCLQYKSMKDPYKYREVLSNMPNWIKLMWQVIPNP